MSADSHTSSQNARRARRSELVLGGLAAGLVAGLLVGVLMAYQGLLGGRAIGSVPAWGLWAAYGALIGAVLGPIVGHRPRGVAMAVSAGMLGGLLGWLAWFLTLDPVLRGEPLTWSAEVAGEHYRELVGSLLYGALAGALFHVLAALYGRRNGTSEEPPPAPRVVIVGGGFAGVAAAQRFERLALRGHRCDVTLVSDSNYLLFTPMLAEVASGALQAQHISAPIRAAASHTRFFHGRVEAIDTARRRIRVGTGPGGGRTLLYDHLVLAVGGVPDFLGLPGVAEHALTLKNLGDARGIRDHVLGLLERADLEPDAAQRRRLLTFVVAGGGFAGTETVAEIFDLVHQVLHYYPGVHPEDPRFVLVHGGERILPELSPELGAYALERLRARGIEFRLRTRVGGAGPEDVALSDGERIPARTLVWAAGGRSAPLLDLVPAARGRGGALIVDTAFRVPGVDGLWAIGDCAQIPDPARPGETFPPTAQHALREGKALADNITAVLRGRPPKEFTFRAMGAFVALGHRTAAGEIRGRRFSGVLAWLLWRGIYLAKLPGIEKRARVAFDWTLDLAFPRDIAVTAPASVPARGRAPAAPTLPDIAITRPRQPEAGEAR